MKYVLAISGGVDSCVLLDMIAKGLFHNLCIENVIVAHFDHGIRKESVADSEFVKKLSNKYKIKSVFGKKELGENASEDLARQARYEFLRSIAVKESAKIITAHHQDDLLETIVMNILRGTNWRGLTPMWSSDIERPLIRKTKSDLIEYAIKNKLEWAEDETNFSAKYFRNRIRNVVYRAKPEYRNELIKLYEKQKTVRNEVEDILKNKHTIIEKRDLVTLPNSIAIEVLRKWTDEKITYPQLKRLLSSIKATNGGIDIQPGGGLVVSLRKNKLTLKKLN
jgi:tRNA(Ile)-lysidine synthetase, N-terminal domain